MIKKSHEYLICYEYNAGYGETYVHGVGYQLFKCTGLTSKKVENLVKEIEDKNGYSVVITNLVKLN